MDQPSPEASDAERLVTDGDLSEGEGEDEEEFRSRRSQAQEEQEPGRNTEREEVTE
jgi:hypothetical protein